jgi:hypothetical protein
MAQFGVRQMVNLLVTLVLFYLRHKEAIDTAFPPEASAALETLADAIEVIKTLNNPGPL